jgi:DNA segregation ATPase FtsK/SpoIIIE, S-DNA-T family
MLSSLAKDFLALFYLLSCLVILACLISYSAFDQSINVFSQSEPGNWLGIFGAILSDLCFQSLGLAAFILPFILLRSFFKMMGFYFGKGFLWVLLMFVISLGQELFLSSLSNLYPNALMHLVWGPFKKWPFIETAKVFLFALGMIFILKSLKVISFSKSLLLFNTFRFFRKKENSFYSSDLQEEEPSYESPSLSRPSPLQKKKKPAPKTSNVEAQERPFGLQEKFELPPLHLLLEPLPQKSDRMIKQDVQMQKLENVFEDFGVKGSILKAHPGPIVTLYELEPAAGVKSARVIGLADDIARSMSALSARVSLIPGKNVMGIELANSHRETVYLKEIFASREYHHFQGSLALALGKDISGQAVIADLAKMPHLLVAGTTGSGKSVGINAMILSILYRLSPQQCRFIMIDPKMLELSVYDGIPHLLTPVVTQPKKAIMTLKWVVQEMENRYRLLSQLSVRNIEGYNQKIISSTQKPGGLKRKVQVGFNQESEPIFEDQELQLEPLPFIVVIVDEMADLMLVAGKEVEILVQRLAQMARAAGIHLIMATQRPSVDVITGTIKANFPTRISFQVTSKIDSRTILGEQGAEHLLGNGDMLYMAAAGRIIRVHGAFVSDGEIEEVVRFLKQNGTPEYIDLGLSEDGLEDSMGEDQGTQDKTYQMALEIIKRDRKVSTSYLQRQLQIGYNKAARIIEQMEKEGVISTANHVGKREILL